MRDTVLLYTSIKEPVDELTDEQAGKLFKAILAYQTDNDVVLDGLLKVVFLQIKQQIDYNNDRFDDTSKKRSEAGKKGMEKRWNKNNNDNNVITNDNNVKDVITSDNKNNYNDNDNDNDNDNGNDNGNDNDNENVVSKDTKHIYGEYKHVRLTDKEYQKLCEEYGDIDTGRAIRYLDEYIEMKGYKAKSHYLCIRKWVFDALKREKKPVSGTSIMDERAYNDKKRMQKDYYGNSSDIS